MPCIVGTLAATGVMLAANAAGTDTLWLTIVSYLEELLKITVRIRYAGFQGSLVNTAHRILPWKLQCQSNIAGIRRPQLHSHFPSELSPRASLVPAPRASSLQVIRDFTSGFRNVALGSPLFKNLPITPRRAFSASAICRRLSAIA